VYYILNADGTRAGPYAEEEILDLLEGGTLRPDAPCLHEASGRIRPAGAMFQVLEPEQEAAPAPVPWQPAPFPREVETAKADRPRPRLLYRGNPCVFTYWRSVLAAGVLVAAGLLMRERWPAGIVVCHIASSVVLMAAILHRMRTQYTITGTRVEVTSGLLARSSRELRIADIRAINVTRTGLSGVLGIGSITFSSAAGQQDDVVFRRVLGASRLKEIVRGLQDGA
jgi:membrane protein YdbS with pleckstrin-like domain